MKEFLEILAPYRKSLVPLVVLGALGVVAKLGIMPDMTVKDALTLVVTAGFVYLVPNKVA